MQDWIEKLMETNIEIIYDWEILNNGKAHYIKLIKIGTIEWWNKGSCS